MGDRPDRAARPVGGGGVRAAHRLRERREPAAGARVGAPAGDRRPRGARREPRAPRAAAPHRQRAPRARRRRSSASCSQPGAFGAIAILGARACRGSREVAVNGSVLAFTCAVDVSRGCSSGWRPPSGSRRSTSRARSRRGTSASSTTAVWAAARTLRRLLVDRRARALGRPAGCRGPADPKLLARAATSRPASTRRTC